MYYIFSLSQFYFVIVLYDLSIYVMKTTFLTKLFSIKNKNTFLILKNIKIYKKKSNISISIAQRDSFDIF